MYSVYGALVIIYEYHFVFMGTCRFKHGVPYIDIWDLSLQHGRVIGTLWQTFFYSLIRIKPHLLRGLSYNDTVLVCRFTSVTGDCICKQ